MDQNERTPTVNRFDPPRSRSRFVLSFFLPFSCFFSLWCLVNSFFSSGVLPSQYSPWANKDTNFILLRTCGEQKERSALFPTSRPTVQRSQRQRTNGPQRRHHQKGRMGKTAPLSPAHQKAAGLVFLCMLGKAYMFLLWMLRDALWQTLEKSSGGRVSFLSSVYVQSWCSLFHFFPQFFGSVPAEDPSP